MIACVLHGVENDTLKGEKYTGTGLGLMAAVQTTIDGTQGGTGKQKRQSYKRERKLYAHSVSVVVFKGLRKYHKDLSQTRSPNHPVDMMPTNNVLKTVRSFNLAHHLHATRLLRRCGRLHPPIMSMRISVYRPIST